MKKFTEIETENFEKSSEEFTRNVVLAITAKASHNWIDQVSNICKRFNYFCRWMNGDADSHVFSNYKDIRNIAIKNHLAVFDVATDAYPIQSVLFEGIDYTYIESESTFYSEIFPVEHVRQICDNHFMYSSDFEDNTKYMTDRFRGKLITSLRGYEYLIDCLYNCGYKLPEEEILPILKEKYPILFIHTLDRYYKEKFANQIISKYYDLAKVEDFYVVLVRKGVNIKLEF